MKNRERIYIIVLTILLILMIIVSFETGKVIYKLTNTNLNDKSTILKSNVAKWQFDVRVEV